MVPTNALRSTSLLVLLLGAAVLSPRALRASTCANPASNLGFIDSYANGETTGDPNNPVDGLNGGEAVAISPEGAHVYTASYFDHAVSVFSRDVTSGELTFIEAIENGEPTFHNILRNARDVALSPDGVNVYATADLDDTLSVFTRNSTTGALTLLNWQTDGVNGADGLDGARGVIVSADGENVYVAGFDEDEIAWFTRDPNTGNTLYRNRVKNGEASGGNTITKLNGPWGLAISPDGQHLYAATWHDSSIVVFSRDQDSGDLTFVSPPYTDGQSGVDGLDRARGIAVSADGANVYAVGFGDHAIAAFSRTASGGALTFLNAIKEGGFDRRGGYC